MWWRERGEGSEVEGGCARARSRSIKEALLGRRTARGVRPSIAAYPPFIGRTSVKAMLWECGGGRRPHLLAPGPHAKHSKKKCCPFFFFFRHAVAARFFLLSNQIAPRLSATRTCGHAPAARPSQCQGDGGPVEGEHGGCGCGACVDGMRAPGRVNAVDKSESETGGRDASRFESGEVSFTPICSPALPPHLLLPRPRSHGRRHPHAPRPPAARG